VTLQPIGDFGVGQCGLALVAGPIAILMSKKAMKMIKKAMTKRGVLFTRARNIENVYNLVYPFGRRAIFSGD
jgi:phage terminase large subunit-like protein